MPHFYLLFVQLVDIKIGKWYDIREAYVYWQGMQNGALHFRIKGMLIKYILYTEIFILHPIWQTTQHTQTHNSECIAYLF